MLGQLDLNYAHYTNTIGLAICFAVVMASRWRFKERNRTNRILILLLLCVVVSCIMHSVAVVVDGRPGQFMNRMVYISNSWLFLASLFSGQLWVLFMEENIHGTRSVIHMRILQLISIFGYIVLFFNLYMPIVFAVNSNNVYSRRSFFYLYMIIELIFLFDAVNMYMKAKYVHGVITMFPVWTYIIPILAGMIIQLMIYGIAMIWPCSAISVAILFSSFNTEDRYRDILTGVYNKTYYDMLQDRFIRNKNHTYVILRVNVLGIGVMGSVQGREMENDARVEFAKTLSRAVKPIGLLTQYDSDTYAVFFSGNNEGRIEEFKERILQELEALNEKKKMNYSLSVIMGYESFDAEKTEIETVIKQIGNRL